MENSKEKIKRYIIENFLFGDDEGMDDQTSFLDTGIIDSTGILELVDFLDEEFNIKISDDEILPENLDSMNNIIHFLEKKSVVSETSKSNISEVNLTINSFK